jgi:hypothetical protein
MTLLVSFDIDGTLEVGDPPGPISMEMVRQARRRGHIIGSASDRTLREQQGMWDDHGIVVDFVGHKHRLETIRDRFSCDRWIHIGDTSVDRHYAILAGFEFWLASDVPVTGDLTAFF